jgi:hypothetical protein
MPSISDGAQAARAAKGVSRSIAARPAYIIEHLILASFELAISEK